MTDAILTIDQGTTSTKCVLVGADGTIVARAAARVASRFPRPGWVEQDLLERRELRRRLGDADDVGRRLAVRRRPVDPARGAERHVVAPGQVVALRLGVDRIREEAGAIDYSEGGEELLDDGTREVPGERDAVVDVLLAYGWQIEKSRSASRTRR